MRNILLSPTPLQPSDVRAHAYKPLEKLLQARDVVALSHSYQMKQFFVGFYSYVLFSPKLFAMLSAMCHTQCTECSNEHTLTYPPTPMLCTSHPQRRRRRARQHMTTTPHSIHISHALLAWYTAIRKCSGISRTRKHSHDILCDARLFSAAGGSLSAASATDCKSHRPWNANDASVRAKRLVGVRCKIDNIPHVHQHSRHLLDMMVACYREIHPGKSCAP